MRILITNSVPLNGGDEALLRALLAGLQGRWPNAELTVLCKDVDLCRKQLPDLQLASDLEFAAGEEARAETLAHYRAADLVISSPGGFLHDHYGVTERLKGFETALGLSKPVVLLAQSIGPFWRPESLRYVRKVLNRVSRICVRDETSIAHLERAGVDPSRIALTADMAFLWHRLAPDLFRRRDGEPVRRLGLSFRPWPLGDPASTARTIEKAEALCRFLLEDPARTLLFLSTCQGIPGYTDDSELAAQIVSRLPVDLKARCSVDRARYAPVQLIQALGACDAFIGMRLHGCILSMLAGVPAMGLGYEEKTAEIFAQMGLQQWQVHFEEPAARWVEKAAEFLANLPAVRERLPEALAGRCAAAEENFMELERECENPTRRAALTPRERWTSEVKRYAQPHLRLRQVASLVSDLKPKRLLDLGCATGHLRTLCPPETEYVGCDFVGPEVPDFEFHRCDFNREPLPSVLHDFNVIVCSGLLEYIDDLRGFLADVHRRLVPDGHAVVTYFNMNHISRISALLCGRSFAVHPDWKGYYSPRDIRSLIRESGFEIVRSLATSHGLGHSTGVEDSVSAPLRLRNSSAVSDLLAHQLIFVARKS